MLDEETLIRIATQREKFIYLLRKYKETGITNAELSKVSLTYTARISELRSLGYKIKDVDLGGGLSNYFLISEPKERQKLGRAIDIFWDIISSYGESVTKQELKEILDNNRFNVVRNWGANT